MLDNIQIQAEFLVLGDFNCNMLQRLPQTTNLKSILVQHQLSQLIKDPTRISETSTSLLDLIATTHPEKIHDSGVCHLSISDHSFVYVVHRARSVKKPPRKITFRNFKRFEEHEFRDDVRSLPLQMINGIDDPDLAWSTWKTLFTEACDKHAPLKTTTVRGDPCPWMSNYVKDMMRQRDYLHCKAIKTKSESDWISYKKLRNEVTLLMRKEKETYYKTLISNSNKDPKGIWSTLKKLLPKPSKTPNNIEIDEKITSPSKIANHFNSYFATIASKLGESLQTNLQPVWTSATCSSFKFLPIQIPSVLNELKSLRVNKGAGPDNIPPRLLKAAADIIAPSLA